MFNKFRFKFFWPLKVIVPVKFAHGWNSNLKKLIDFLIGRCHPKTGQMEIVNSVCYNIHGAIRGLIDNSALIYQVRLGSIERYFQF